MPSKELKLFSPTIMFNDYPRSAWIKNMTTVADGKLPIHAELKKMGVYAISIEPSGEGEWYAFGLPIRKDWRPCDLSGWKGVSLMFEAVVENPVMINVELASSKDEKCKVASKMMIEHTEGFGEVAVSFSECHFLKDLKMVIWSGSKTSPEWVVKNIRLVEK